MLDRLRDPFGFGRPGFERHAKDFGDLPRLDGQRVLITGASGGLGQAARSACEALGAQTFDASRSSGWDLTDPARLRALAQELEQVDVLVHNAGVLPTAYQETTEGLELALALNLVATHRLTRLLPAKKVIWVSSGGGLTQSLEVEPTFTPPKPYDGVVQYARTKRAEIVLAKLWAKERPESCFAAMHPGWADTPGVSSSLPTFHKLTQGVLRSPDQGADTIVWLCGAHVESGKFWFDRKEADALPVPTVRSDAAEEAALWARLEALV
ncbi:MAG: dehydrogenase/reductase SDR family protein 12 [Cognaticolwellia sp.]|jgi:dehydrogenase/reductase SDR family protein 12